MAMNKWLIDIDDTLAHSVAAVILFHNYVYGTALTKNNFTGYNIRKALYNKDKKIISFKKEMERMHEFYESKFFLDIKPIAEMKIVIETIKKFGDEIYIATGRGERVRGHTEKMIKDYFGDHFEDFFFTEWHAGKELNDTKKDIAKRIGINKVIDDMPKYINDLRGLELVDGIYVPKNPWNTDITETGKIKIYTEPKQIIEHTYRNVA